MSLILILTLKQEDNRKKMSSPKENNSIDILLVGKTGSGKSATGNSILQRKSFATANTASSETFYTQKDWSVFNEREILLVDTPGLGDTRLDNKGDIKKAVKEMSEAMAMNTEGFHAIIFVVKFGCRFTADDVNAISILKQIFGKNFMRCHGILLFTFGDNFETDDEVYEENLTFEKWLAKQTEPNLQALIQECGSRTILFNNRLRDEMKKQSQIKRLIQIVDSLTKEGKRYTNDIFQKAQEERDKLLKNLKRPYLKEDHLKKISLITRKLGLIKIDSQNLDQALTHLRDLESEADSVHIALVEDDKATKALEVAIKVVKRLLKSITEQIDQVKALKSKAEKEGKLRKELEEARVKLQREKEEFELRRKKQEEEEALKAKIKFEELQIETQKAKEIIAAKEAEERKQLQLEKQRAFERDEEDRRRNKQAEEDYFRRKDELAKLAEERVRQAQAAEEQQKLAKIEAEKSYQDMRKTELNAGVIQNVASFVISTVSKFWPWWR